MNRPATKSEPWDRAALALAVLLPLVCYGATLARYVTFVDGGELAAAAAVLGIPHPPGYPLFTLLGHLFSKLPFGTVFSRVALLSAASMALTSGLVFHMIRSASTEITGTTSARVLARAAALTGALLFAFARTPWSQAVVVEVYGLHVLLVSACLAACLELARPGSTLRLYVPAFLFTLCFTHHLTAVLLLPALLIATVLALRSRRRTPWRELGVAAIAALLPFSIYLYLPIRSRLKPPVNWDYPESWYRLTTHVSAAQYRPMLGSDGFRWDELGRFLSVQLPHEATLLLPALAILGAIVLWRESRRVLVITAPLALGYLLYNSLYAIHDIEVYYLPVVPILAVWAGVGAVWLARISTREPRPLQIAFLIGCVALLAWTAAANARHNDRRDQRVADAYIRDLLRYVEPRAVLFSDDGDHVSEPSIYLQQVERVRPDVVVLDLSRLESPMLERNLAEWCPDLAAACREEVAEVAKYAQLAERRLPYDGKAWDHAYDVMMYSLAHEAVRLRPTYSLIGAINRPMFEGLKWNPEGLAVRLTSEDVYTPFPLPRFELPELLRGRELSAEEGELLNQYGRMLDGRTWYLQRHGQSAQLDSLAIMRQALSSNP